MITLAWAWIPITLGAALAQTVRNAAQRSLVASAGTLAATFVRFVYGLPFALAALAVASFLAGWTLPAPNARFVAWVIAGAGGQLVATALLLAAMKQRAFVVSVAYSKTEVVQVALLSIVLLREGVTAASAVAIALATVGVILLSLKGGKPAAGGDEPRTTATLLGLGSGASFAVSAVGYRGAALALPGHDAFLVGTYALVWAQVMQSIVLGAYLAARQPQALVAVTRAWRVSLLAGFMGTAASVCWLTAFALRPAADVRALGMVEMLFSYAVSWRVLRERITARELAGIGLLAVGLVVLCLQL